MNTRFKNVKDFILGVHFEEMPGSLPAVSLFSGAGLSDLGYQCAGFHIVVQAEKDSNRAELCASNFPEGKCVVGDLHDTCKTVVDEYQGAWPDSRPALLSVTPPCQGMSSSNPGLGARTNGRQRDERNQLLLEAIPVINALKPRVIVVENVPQILTEPHDVTERGDERTVMDAFAAGLHDYYLFGGVVQMADYGVAQDRRRAVTVAVHSDEPWAERLYAAGRGPWPVATHAKESTNGRLSWVAVDTWIKQMSYKPLDAISEQSARDEDDPLHLVPYYEGDYYWRVADIPKKSGRSAYQNSNCRECSRGDVPEGTATCPYCGATMHNRPYVVEDDGTVRLIKGRHSSYKRMRHDQPARTITTASSHVGSDYKIHPWENRVLSIRECADLQAIPRFYNWSWALESRHTYLARVVIGEAFPPWFTYLQGRLLLQLLEGHDVSEDTFALCKWSRKPVPSYDET